MRARRFIELLPDGTRYYRVAASRSARHASPRPRARRATPRSRGAAARIPRPALRRAPRSAARSSPRSCPPAWSSGGGMSDRPPDSASARPGRRAGSGRRGARRSSAGCRARLASSVGVRSGKKCSTPRTPYSSPVTSGPVEAVLHQLSQRHPRAKALEENVRCTLGRKTRGKRSTGIHARRYCHMEVTLLADRRRRVGRGRADELPLAEDRGSSPSCSGESLPPRSRRSPASCPACRGRAGSGSGIRRSTPCGSTPRPSRRSRSPTWTRRSRRDPGRDGPGLGGTAARDPRLAAGARDRGRGELHPPALHRGAAPGRAGRADGGRDREGGGRAR